MQLLRFLLLGQSLPTLWPSLPVSVIYQHDQLTKSLHPSDSSKCHTGWKHLCTTKHLSPLSLKHLPRGLPHTCVLLNHIGAEMQSKPHMNHPETAIQHKWGMAGVSWHCLGCLWGEQPSTVRTGTLPGKPHLRSGPTGPPSLGSCSPMASFHALC